MSLLDSVKELRSATKAELEALLQTATDEKRGLNETETATYDSKLEDLRSFDARIEELIEAEKREAAAAKHISEITPSQTYVTPESRVTGIPLGGVKEPNPVYRQGDSSSPSFFRDLAAERANRTIQLGSSMITPNEARTRLAAAQEFRAGDMTTVAGAGGEFAPPKWLVEDYLPLLRAGRQMANLMQQEPLPSGISSINLPKVSTGTTTAVQVLQNSSVSDTAMTTTSVSSGITTIAGKQIIAMQLLEQSGIPFDRVVMGDLARDYAKQLDVQVIAGTGANGQLRGLDHAAGLGTTTYTSAAPAVVSVTTANSFYNRIISAVNSIEAKFIRPNAIVMHPQRWNWVLEALDTANRPLVLPNGQTFNAVGSANALTPEGAAGSLLGLPVYTDANIAVNIGTSTNQDVVYVLNSTECWLFESALQQASFDATYADQASILFRVLGYSAFIPDRYAGAVNAMNGTGLVTPTL